MALYKTCDIGKIQAMIDEISTWPPLIFDLLHSEMDLLRIVFRRHIHTNEHELDAFIKRYFRGFANACTVLGQVKVGTRGLSMSDRSTVPTAINQLLHTCKDATCTRPICRFAANEDRTQDIVVRLPVEGIVKIMKNDRDVSKLIARFSVTSTTFDSIERTLAHTLQSYAVRWEKKLALVRPIARSLFFMYKHGEQGSSMYASGRQLDLLKAPLFGVLVASVLLPILHSVLNLREMFKF